MNALGLVISKYIGEDKKVKDLNSFMIKGHLMDNVIDNPAMSLFMKMKIADNEDKIQTPQIDATTESLTNTTPSEDPKEEPQDDPKGEPVEDSQHPEKEYLKSIQDSLKKIKSEMGIDSKTNEGLLEELAKSDSKLDDHEDELQFSLLRELRLEASKFDKKSFFEKLKKEANKEIQKDAEQEYKKHEKFLGSSDKYIDSLKDFLENTENLGKANFFKLYVFIQSKLIFLRRWNA